MPESAPKRPVTPADLIGLSQIGSIALSPDGERIAYVSAQPDLARSEVRAQIHLLTDLDDKEPTDRQLTRALDDSRRPAWSPDGETLAFVSFRPQPQEDESDDQREDGSDKLQVFALGLEGGDARRVTEAPEGVDLFRWSPDGEGVFTLGVAPRPAAEQGWRRRRRDQHDDGIVVYGDIPIQEIVFHPFEGRPHRVIAGVKGVEDFDVSPDGRFIAYATNHTGLPEDVERAEIVLFELETGKTWRASDGREGAESSPRFTGDGKHLLFHGWADPKLSFSRQELFAVDVDQLAADAQPPCRPLLGPIDRDLEGFTTFGADEVVVSVAWGLTSRLFRLHVPSGKAEPVAMKPGYVSRLATCRGVVDADSGQTTWGTRIAAVVETADQPPRVALIDEAIAEPARFVSSRLDEVDEWQLGSRQHVRWTHDGFEHEGLLLRPPAGPDDINAPLLVWIHGGPHWRAIDTLTVYEAECFASAGYAVFMPQYRGSSGYSQDYALASRHDLGGADAQDILAGIDHVLTLGGVDADRIAVTGSSYGGYMTNWLLATTDRFKAGISVAGIFDLAQDYATSEAAIWEVSYLGGAPWEQPELYRERSPIHHAAKIDAPMLILHGMEDDTTLFTNSKGLFRALTAQKKIAELVFYPREGHGLFEPQHRIDAVQRMLEWLDRHVKSQPAVHVPGRTVHRDGLSLTPLGHQTRREYAGIRSLAGRVFLEVSVLLAADEDGPDLIQLIPCGSSSDIVLIDGNDSMFRPIGVPLDVFGQQQLFTGRGAIESARTEDGRPASLAVTVVAEVPDHAARYRLSVMDLPEVILAVPTPDPDDDATDEEPASTDAPASSDTPTSDPEPRPENAPTRRKNP